jgi:signal transduction histidine kinase
MYSPKRRTDVLRLYLRFYLALLASLIVFMFATAAIWHHLGGPQERGTAKFAQLIQNTLPAANAPAPEQQAALQRVAYNLDTEISLLSAERAPIAAVGRPLSLPSEHEQMRGWLHPWEKEPVWSMRLPDGRWVVAAMPTGYRHPVHALLLTLSLIALAVAVGAFPVVRRLNKRLERLQRGVESLGGGNLAARVAVEGRDEVARLAQSFNNAAARIEQLVGAHKTLLANASHELRTPLTRIRVAVELAKQNLLANQKDGLNQDIAELDRLIEEILLASRLDALPETGTQEEVDLLALAAEECARYPDVELDGSPCLIRGEPALLRSMLRNLLENAHTHGRPPVHVVLTRVGDGIRITVEDQGPGIPEAERERVFEPFYRRSESRNARGSGLGLSLVRQIARRHGGDAVWIQRHGMQGVEVCVREGGPASAR